MMKDWHFLWCPHPHCNRVTISTRSPDEDEKILAEHRVDCDGLRYEREIAAAEARMRLEGRWVRVARRWGLPERGGQ